MAYGSQLSSQGTVTLAATQGDLTLIGSQVSGHDVALSARHDLTLLSQAEQHTDSNTRHNASGEVGLSLGQTTGLYLSAAAGEALAHGNGTTHADSVVNAADTLTLTSGDDTTLRGAQATGHTVRAAIGGNLDLASEQDTNDYASHSLQAGLTLIYGWSNGGVGVSGNLGASQAKANDASVTQLSGIGAGHGGFDLNVGGHTDLKGAVIASTAAPAANRLATGSLSYSNLENVAKSSAESLSVGGGSGGGGLSGLSGFSGGPGVPQHRDQHSTTQAGLAPGTIVVGNNTNPNLAGLDRNPSLDNANGLTDRFNPQQVAEDQQAGLLAGQVGMTAAGDLASAAGWKPGSAQSVTTHAIVGAATAALGGGNVLQGAEGAAMGEASIPLLQKTLINNGIGPYSVAGNALMSLGSALIGGTVGGGAGTATALAGNEYNRALHPDELALLTQLEQGQSSQEVQNLQAAACYLTSCAAGVPTSDPNYTTLLTLQVEGGSAALAPERALLSTQTASNGDALFGYGTMDALSDWNGRTQASTRALGGLQLVGGSLEAIGGVATASTCETIIGCAAATYLTGAGVDNASAGANTLVTGQSTATLGQQALGLSPNAASLVYGATQLVPAGIEGYTANSAANAQAAANTSVRASYLLAGDTGASATVNADGTLTLAGSANSLNTVGSFEQLAGGDPAIPTPGGYINQAKVCASQCALTISDPADQALAQQIAQNGDPTGQLTEQLVNSVAENQGMTVLAGGKYGSNNGFDTVLQNTDGSVTILVDAKQMTNGTFTLSQGAGNQLQLSPGWINNVIAQLGDTPAAQAIIQARDTDTLSTAVIGVNKSTSQLIGVPVKIDQ